MININNKTKNIFQIYPFNHKKHQFNLLKLQTSPRYTSSKKTLSKQQFKKLSSIQLKTNHKLNQTKIKLASIQNNKKQKNKVNFFLQGLIRHQQTISKNRSQQFYVRNKYKIQQSPKYNQQTVEPDINNKKQFSQRNQNKSNNLINKHTRIKSQIVFSVSKKIEQSALSNRSKERQKSQMKKNSYLKKGYKLRHLIASYVAKSASSDININNYINMIKHSNPEELKKKMNLKQSKVVSDIYDSNLKAKISG